MSAGAADKCKFIKDWKLSFSSNEITTNASLNNGTMAMLYAGAFPRVTRKNIIATLTDVNGKEKKCPFPTTLRNPCYPLTCKTIKKGLEMKSGTKGVDYIDVASRIDCIYPGTTFSISLGADVERFVSINRYDFKNNRVYLDARKFTNFNDRTNFTFSDGITTKTCPIDIEIFTCDLECRSNKNTLKKVNIDADGLVTSPQSLKTFFKYNRRECDSLL